MNQLNDLKSLEVVEYVVRRPTMRIISDTRAVKTTNPVSGRARCMPFKSTRYAGVEGKTVEYVETTYEQDFVYIHVCFDDKTALSFSLVSGVILYHAALYNERTGDQEVLKEYISRSET
jgi:hypothetical protein